MMRILAMAGVGLWVACASAPTKSPPQVSAPSSDVSSEPLSANQSLPLPFLQSTENLRPGKCRNDFDCYDNSGFPASGRRWDCKKQKCMSVPLPNQGSGAASRGNNPDRPKTRKSSAGRKKSSSAI